MVITEDRALLMLKDANPVPDVDAFATDVEAAKYLVTLDQRSSEVTRTAVRQVEQVREKKTTTRWLAAAAAIAALVGVGFAFVNAGGSPSPDFGWALDGDGTASAGSVDLKFSGVYEFTDEAVSFDGHSGSAAADGPGPVDTTSSFTVSAWVNYAAPSAIATAVSQLGQDSYGFALGVGETNWWFAMKSEDLTGVEHATWAAGPLKSPSTDWVHVVGVYDSEAGLIRLFIDGDQVGEAAFSAPFDATGPLTIGRGQADGTAYNYWPGSVGSVEIYQEALTPGQIAGMYETSAPSSAPPSRPAADPSTYGEGILNGTWDYLMASDEADQVLANFGFSATEVRVRLGFDDNEWWLGFLFDGELSLAEGVPEGDGGTFVIEGDRILLTGDTGGSARVTYEWALNGDMLTLVAIEECGLVPDTSCVNDRGAMDPMMLLVTEHTYTKSSDDPSY